MYLRVLSFYWHRQRAHLSNSVHRTRRRKEFRPLFCAMYPEAYWQRLEKPANNIITHPNSETVCSIVTKSMLIIFHLQTGFWFACLFNFDSTIELITRNRRLKSSGLSLSRDNPSRRQGARDWAVKVGLRRVCRRSCTCVIWMRCWLLKRHDLDTAGMNAGPSLESSIMWVCAMLLTPKWVVWAF